jgi:hypothetical protein
MFVQHDDFAQYGAMKDGNLAHLRLRSDVNPLIEPPNRLVSPQRSVTPLLDTLDVHQILRFESVMFDPSAN